MIDKISFFYFFFLVTLANQRMVVWWLCWHRTILMKYFRQKQYPQFPPVHDFGKPWWGVAYVPCVTNLPALYAWVIRWHVTGMLSLAEHWHGRRALPIMFVLTQSYPCDTSFVCSTLRELAMSNLGQLLFCVSVTWSRCCNACRDLGIMTIMNVIKKIWQVLLQHQKFARWRNSPRGMALVTPSPVGPKGPRPLAQSISWWALW